jgi:hypothetical protein
MNIYDFTPLGLPAKSLRAEAHNSLKVVEHD